VRTTNVASSNATSPNPAPIVTTLVNTVTAWVGASSSNGPTGWPNSSTQVIRGIGNIAPEKNITTASGKFARTNALTSVRVTAATMSPTPMTDSVARSSSSPATQIGPSLENPHSQAVRTVGPTALPPSRVSTAPVPTT